VHLGLPAEIFGVDGIIILVVVVLVLFGSTQIPKLARSLGSAQKEFKKGLDEGHHEDPTTVKAQTVVVEPTVVPPTTKE
jgi:sec-independent protein translocase protein TatA